MVTLKQLINDLRQMYQPRCRYRWTFGLWFWSNVGALSSIDGFPGMVALSVTATPPLDAKRIITLQSEATVFALNNSLRTHFTQHVPTMSAIIRITLTPFAIRASIRILIGFDHQTAVAAFVIKQPWMLMGGTIMFRTVRSLVNGGFARHHA